MTISELVAICQANGLAISDAQAVLLERYQTLLRETNQVVNLISRKDEENILEKHLLHSLTIAMPGVTGFEIPKAVSIFDIGTGGGLPGIPLKIVRPDLSVVVCDSIAKKITAVSSMIASLNLLGITAIVSRAEDLPKIPKHRKAYDVIVSRAVAPLYELVKWTKDLLKPQTTLLSLKGGDLSEEIGRTKQIPFVKEVVESPLSLSGYDGFVTEEKKVVRVKLA